MPDRWCQSSNYWDINIKCAKFDFVEEEIKTVALTIGALFLEYFNFWYCLLIFDTLI